MLWDLFCRVIDNHGDVGVCWRLAADLAERGEHVRLWIDDDSALRWMAPDGAAEVEVRDWLADSGDATDPGDVVIEAFGCELPPPFLRRMAGAARAPTWINLEYLSAEGVVERNHGLPSPQSHGPAAGLHKWFYYPGFTVRTGGLIRERELSERQRAFDRAAWLQDVGAAWDGNERVVSLFCYAQPALAALIERLSAGPVLLLACVGFATDQTRALLGPSLRRRELRALLLPPLTQRDYDHLLWASDLNFVRGEDSFVRAQWAAKPFVWQAYPQHDGAHRAKLAAYLGLHLARVPEPRRAFAREFWVRWNDAGTALPDLPALEPWQRDCVDWRGSLLAQEDLSTRLLAFVAERR
jgi:uncharacterized repeat protein (TIGR03837 family)